MFHCDEPRVPLGWDESLSAELLHCCSHHDPGSNTGQRNAGRLRYERNRSAAPGVCLEDEDVITFDRELDVDQSEDPK